VRYPHRRGNRRELETAEQISERLEGEERRPLRMVLPAGENFLHWVRRILSHKSASLSKAKYPDHVLQHLAGSVSGAPFRYRLDCPGNHRRRDF
jgi:hypothetical protein